MDITRALMCEVGGRPSNSATSSMVFLSGVAKASGKSLPAGSGISGCFGRVTAFSKFARYPDAGHSISQSSPAGDGTMNSHDSLPPIAPEWASTGRYSNPLRSKIRQYAL